jgi:hypothetical protein
MKTGSCCTTNGLSDQGAFADELLQDVTDFMHVFLMDSSLRVSLMKRPISSIFVAMGIAR